MAQSFHANLKALLESRDLSAVLDDLHLDSDNEITDESVLESTCDVERLNIPFGKAFPELAEAMTDIHENVKKRVVRRGLRPTVTETSLVTVHFEMYTKMDEPFDSTVLRKKASIIKMDDPDLMEGFQIALLSMCNGETAHFLIGWQVAFGEYGCPPRCPPKADIFLAVHICNISSQVLKSLSDNFDENYNECEGMLQRGKTLYMEGKHGACIKTMFEGLKFLDGIVSHNDEQSEALQTLRMRINSNLCGILNRVNRPERAIVRAREALRLDPNNELALIAIGTAHLRLGNYKLSHEFLTKGRKLYPNNQEFVKQLGLLSEKKSQAQ